MPILLSSDHTKIAGTLEVIKGVSFIDNVHKDDKGTLRFDYSGETEILWNTQKTVLNKKKRRLFVDVNYDIYSEDELKLVD